ncbi:hypothetical protein [Streptococcus dentiloxodontae]
MFNFMVYSFLLMPALGAFLLGFALSQAHRFPLMWLLSIAGLSGFVWSFWHIANIDTAFMLAYILGPFGMGFGLPNNLTKKRRTGLLILGVFFLIFFIFLLYLVTQMLGSIAG